MSLDADALHQIAAVCIGHRTRMAARALTRHYNAHFRPLRLTAGQFGVLVALAGRPGITVAILAEAIGMDPTTMVRAIQQLERRGLVESTGGRGRQAKQSTLTTAGTRMLRRAIPHWEAAYAAIEAELGSKTLNRTLAALAKLERAARRRN